MLCKVSTGSCSRDGRPSVTATTTTTTNNMLATIVVVTVVLMGVCWPEQVAAAQLHHHHPGQTSAGSTYPSSSSYNLNKNLNYNDPKYNQQQHPHRHHHHLTDRQQPSSTTTTTDYPEVAAAAGGDGLMDYENEDNSDGHGGNHFVNDASSRAMDGSGLSSGAGGSSSSSSSGPLMGLLPEPGSYIPSNCTSCIQREELRRRNLEVIKDQILSKLGMQRAPNMTGRLPPRIPPLDHLLDLYGMQGDAPPAGGGHGRGGHHNGGGHHHHHQQSDQAFQTGPVYDEEEDDFHARTEKVIAFSQHPVTLPPAMFNAKEVAGKVQSK
ncbi:hypothetical protein DAPPUDRAFT_114946 [Daphnia pulex]|uniref:TGF-beta propeptide domain-containing protein n=1 Tax=Daphnia pulex TaxID=6669 RepID=E9HJS7_DAPPU|nr:hypothetical protein DAPPUDRAFT_114946 [Daphnia pulex]|eukprot:EFX67989.1 hypothetical protein DAPPUDRAFT_114946 [Daphnia pulex]